MGDGTNGSLEARVQRLEDLQEIRELFLEYGRCLDGKQFGALARLWAEDGQIVNSQGSGPARGHEAIEALMNSMLGSDLAIEPGGEFHVFANPTVELDGDRASGRVMWLYITADEAGYPRLQQMGHYEDVLVREDGRWRFESRDWPRDIGIPGAGVPGVGARA
jgi:uncharacterized protein (TIGR02246 family)